MTETFRPDYDLQSKNSLAVSSKCRWFVSVKDEQQLFSAVVFARENRLPLVVLGSGTNVVLADYLDALVAEIRIPGKYVISRDAESAMVEVGGGENWHQFVIWCLEQKLYGLENLALIPGTCGAAPIQNIGAYGVELSELLDSVEVFDIGEQKLKRFSRAECELSYRDSIFKNELQNRVVVVSIRLRLRCIQKSNLGYPALTDYLELNQLESTPNNVFDAVCAIRRSKLPDPDEIPNAGSFFKNPIIPQAHADRLRKQYSDMPGFPLVEGKEKIPAAWLIDKAGWKGSEHRGVGVHDKQALVLINPGRRNAKDILELADKISADVLTKFGVQLELEPRVID